MHILETGPIFKFLTTDFTPQLLVALGHNVICVPAAVEYEIFDTPRRRKQFARAAEVWRKSFPDRFRRVLSDEPSAELHECCLTVFGLEFSEMYSQTKDRGETMAILHGVLAARSGEQVLIVCDDEAGIRTIERQSAILREQQSRGLYNSGGSISHADTLTLLRWAIQNGAFESKTEFLKRYERMASLDEALPKEIKKTDLLSPHLWKSK